MSSTKHHLLYWKANISTLPCACRKWRRVSVLRAHRTRVASCIIYAMDIAGHASATKRIKKTKEACYRSFLALSVPAAETRIFDIPRTHFLTYRGELFADIVRRSIGARRGTIRETLTHSTTKSRAISVRNVMRAQIEKRNRRLITRY